MAFCFAKIRLFRVPLSLHSFAPLRNWLRQPLQSLPRFLTQILEIEPNKWLSFVKGFGRQRQYGCCPFYRWCEHLKTVGQLQCWTKSCPPLIPASAMPHKPFRNFLLFFFFRNKFYFLFRKIKIFLKMRNKDCILSLWKYWKERIFYKNW